MVDLTSRAYALLTEHLNAAYAAGQCNARGTMWQAEELRLMKEAKAAEEEILRLIAEVKS